MKVVPIHELPAVWPRIRAELEALSKHGSDGWISEDVYAIIVSGNATLYYNDEGWFGFAVLQVIPNYTGKRLHVWVAHIETDPKPYMERLRALARSVGASKITFSSARKGWERRAVRLGFKPSMMIYEQGV